MSSQGVRDRSRFLLGIGLLGLLICASAILLSAQGSHQRRALATARLSRATYSTSGSLAPPEPGLTGRWHWVFDSDFQGQAPNPLVWQPSWFDYGQQITGPINVLESSCYSSQNVSPSSSGVNLALSAQASNCSGQNEPYTGSIITTNPYDGRPSGGGFQFTYGLVQVRMYLPGTSHGQIADWPVIMTLSQPEPQYGEDDVMEGLSGTACSHYHSANFAVGSILGACDTKIHAGWHTFAAYWQPGVVTWYYDGKRLARIHRGVTSTPMYIVLANTTPLQAPNVDQPDVAKVAYVRVWEPVGVGANG